MAAESNNDYAYRFSGITRLYGKTGHTALRQAHVCIIGIGGVGSWIAEAIARTGISEITLVDMDDVCVSNVNRQLHALDGTVGKQKIDVMADRLRAINPECIVHLERSFLTQRTADRLLAGPYNYVVDAIDKVANKCLIIVKCREKGIPILTIGGAGGRQDPSQIGICDLSRSYNDGLLHQVRKKLRQEFGFPRERRRKFKIDCVFSPEAAMFPQSDGTVCATKEAGSSLMLDCESGYGTASFVTGTFGFLAAAHVAKKIVEKADTSS